MKPDDKPPEHSAQEDFVAACARLGVRMEICADNHVMATAAIGHRSSPSQPASVRPWGRTGSVACIQSTSLMECLLEYWSKDYHDENHKHQADASNDWGVCYCLGHRTYRAIMALDAHLGELFLPSHWTEDK